MNTSARSQYLSYLDSSAGYDTYNQFKKYLYGENDFLVQKIYDDVLAPVLSKGHRGVFRMCDIGGGDGKRMVSLLQKAHTNFPKIRFEVLFVEPSKYAFSQAKKSFLQVAEFAQFQGQNCIFENADLRNGQYDFVLFIHSIFTFSNQTNIAKMCNLKRKSGLVLVVSNSEKTFMSKLNQRMHKPFVEKRYETPTFLEDLVKAKVFYKAKEKPNIFFVAKNDFHVFAETVLTWSSMRRYFDFNIQQKIALHDFVLSLSLLSDESGHWFEETEVFITF